MNYNLLIIFSASIFIATITGWVRFKRLNPSWLPLLACFTVASANEILSFILTKSGHFTMVNNNIYVLAEALLLCWQFKKWGLFDRHKILFFILVAVIAAIWIIENLITTGLFKINFYFRISYSFIIVLMSISCINSIIFTYRGRLWKSPVFLCCTGFIIYFTYKILIEAFWLYGLNASRDFRVHVYLFLTWINFFVNLVYALAILWIPKKPQHITLY